MDLWISVESTDLHRVIDLLPSLDWDGSYVGVRVEFCPRDLDEMLKRYGEAKEEAKNGEESDDSAPDRY